MEDSRASIPDPPNAPAAAATPTVFDDIVRVATAAQHAAFDPPDSIGEQLVRPIAQAVARLEPTTDIRAVTRAAGYDFDTLTERSQFGVRIVIGVAEAYLAR